MNARLPALLPLLALACGGGSPTGTGEITGSSSPGTPAPAPPDPGAPAVGASGSNRFQLGAAQGLYLVDPAAGEPAVQGYVVVTLGPIGTGNFIPPPDTTVTMNGVPLLRDPALNGAYWRLDPAGPQPNVGAGGRMVLVASGTVAGALVQRTLVLPCPADVPVASSPAAGASLGATSALHLTSAADLTLNPGVPIVANVHPAATLYGYDPATRALSGAGASVLVPPGPLDVQLPVGATSAPEWLVDLRWAGTWVPDGESGAFCGLAKRWTYAR